MLGRLSRSGDNTPYFTYLSTYPQQKGEEMWINQRLLRPLYFHLVVDVHAEIDELQLAFFEV